MVNRIKGNGIWKFENEFKDNGLSLGMGYVRINRYELEEKENEKGKERNKKRE